jgi:hypothetical protein
MACTEARPHLADYRIFVADEKILIEPIANENCTYGEPDVSVTFGQFAFRKIRFIFVCEDRARRLQLI